MSSTFQPLVECEDTGSDQSAAIQVIKPLKDPWATLFDQSASLTEPETADRLLLGKNITQTPEYLAANLPPYNSSANLMSHFLL